MKKKKANQEPTNLFNPDDPSHFPTCPNCEKNSFMINYCAECSAKLLALREAQGRPLKTRQRTSALPPFEGGTLDEDEPF